ncbi:hypothetical protein BpHYR1_004994 [Brachionus plicatilis]|uniref:Uncharacterized protein n=1 Tax=Brachionus plicatilis TaxID=10195 RepID=A0A3M7S2T0_BRAPC|nr:hypothetical protein BpHYR1_004994 [Brachionus plicatilis]
MFDSGFLQKDCRLENLIYAIAVGCDYYFFQFLTMYVLLNDKHVKNGFRFAKYFLYNNLKIKSRRKLFIRNEKAQAFIGKYLVNFGIFEVVIPILKYGSECWRMVNVEAITGQQQNTLQVSY